MAAQKWSTRGLHSWRAKLYVVIYCERSGTWFCSLCSQDRYDIFVLSPLLSNLQFTIPSPRSSYKLLEIVKLNGTWLCGCFWWQLKGNERDCENGLLPIDSVCYHKHCVLSLSQSYLEKTKQQHAFTPSYLLHGCKYKAGNLSFHNKNDMKQNLIPIWEQIQSLCKDCHSDIQWLYLLKYNRTGRAANIKANDVDVARIRLDKQCIKIRWYSMTGFTL